MGWVFLNGKMVREDEAAVTAFDHGFLYGDGLFETVAVHRARPLLLREHLERLLAGAAWLSYQHLPTQDQLAAAAGKVIAANGVTEGALRLLLTRGAGPGTWDPEGYGPPTIIITAASGTPYREEDYHRGWRAVISSFRQDEGSPLCHLKSLNFLHHVLARREARARGAEEALHLNLRGELAEGSISNVFVVRRGELVTPDVASGLLPGITRAVVLDLARKLGLSVQERPVQPQELQGAEEAFLTSSLMGLMPLVAVDDRPVGAGVPGPVTARLRAAYADLVLAGPA